MCSGQLLEQGADGDAGWRAGGIVVQHLPDTASQPDRDSIPAIVPEGMEQFVFEEDDSWTRAKILVRTTEDHELLDPTLASERLLYRLYHEDGVRAFSPIDIERHCTCSRDRVEDMLRQFDSEDLGDMVKDGHIEVTCEFCNAVYDFDPPELDA